MLRTLCPGSSVHRPSQHSYTLNTEFLTNQVSSRDAQFRMKALRDEHVSIQKILLAIYLKKAIRFDRSCGVCYTE
jgi:hypothetical protein